MIANWLPPTVRKRIYELLVTLYALELIFDVVDGVTESKVLAALGVLGFALARVNTSPTPTDPEV